MSKVIYKPKKGAVTLDEKKALKPYGGSPKTNKTTKEKGKKK